MQARLLLLLLPSFLFVSCYKSENNINIEGYAPIYVDTVTALTIQSLPEVQPIVSAGKIISQSSTIYVVENGKGVHVLDYRYGSAPVYKCFLQIPGCKDLALKGRYLYTNNLNDLITLDIRDVFKPLVTDRVVGTFKNQEKQNLPPFSGFYYQCPYDNDSILVGWQLKVLVNPNCYYE